MIDLGTAHDELGNLLEVFRLALAIHTAAEAKMFDVLLAALRTALLSPSVAATTSTSMLTPASWLSR